MNGVKRIHSFNFNSYWLHSLLNTVTVIKKKRWRWLNKTICKRLFHETTVMLPYRKLFMFLLSSGNVLCNGKLYSSTYCKVPHDNTKVTYMRSKSNFSKLGNLGQIAVISHHTIKLSTCDLTVTMDTLDCCI
jgi:hypothetical protein